jgi:hypothetical protein
MNRTLLSSTEVTESVQYRRMIICVNSNSLLGHWYFLNRVLLGEWSKFLECIEFALLAQNWKATCGVTMFAAQCVAALTISILQDRRDKRWVQLASGLLRVPNSLLHQYISNGDSILLANAIFIVRQTLQTYLSNERHREDILRASTKTLETVCKLKIEDTLPELQSEFCCLRNELFRTVQTDNRPHHHVDVAKATLNNISELYHRNESTRLAVCTTAAAAAH